MCHGGSNESSDGSVFLSVLRLVTEVVGEPRSAAVNSISPDFGCCGRWHCEDIDDKLEKSRAWVETGDVMKLLPVAAAVRALSSFVLVVLDFVIDSSLSCSVRAEGEA